MKFIPVTLNSFLGCEKSLRANISYPPTNETHAALLAVPVISDPRTETFLVSQCQNVVCLYKWMESNFSLVYSGGCSNTPAVVS